MITCERSCTYRSSLLRHGLACDGVSVAIDRRARRHAGLHLQRARDPRRVSRHRRRVRRLSARDPLRAEGELDAGDRPRCCARSAAAPTPTPAARSRWRCAPASRRATSSSPASARRARSSSTRSARASARSTPSRPGELDRIAAIAPRAGPRGARRAARQSRHRRAEPSRTSPPGCEATSSACRCRTRAPSIASAAASTGLRFVGVHVHIGSQITTAEPLRRAAEALVTLALELRDDGFALEHVDLGGGLGIAYEGRPMITPAEYAAAVHAGAAARRPAGRARAGPRDRRPFGRAGRAGRRHQAVSRRPAVRRARRRHERADAAGALRLVPPHRPGGAARRRRERRGTSSARSARAATCSRAIGSCRRSRSTIWWRMLDAGAYGR